MPSSWKELLTMLTTSNIGDNLFVLFSAAKYCPVLFEKNLIPILNVLAIKYHLERRHELEHLAQFVVIRCLGFGAQAVGLL